MCWFFGAVKSGGAFCDAVVLFCGHVRRADSTRQSAFAGNALANFWGALVGFIFT